MGAMAGVFLDAIPDYLRGLTALAVAILDRRGTVIDANQGFLLLAHRDTLPETAWNAAPLFINPTFSEISHLDAQDERVYEGIINIGNMETASTSLNGAVYALGGGLVIVAEADMRELTRLNAMVIELNDELSEMQRSLVRSNRQLQRNEVKIHELMLTDPLTGLANRRRLDERMATEIARAQRYDKPLCLVMADIDHFKRVNDTYGHGVGDRVIQRLACVLQDNIREVDLAARLGGEEFVLLLPECEMEGAVAYADRIRLQTAAAVVEPVEYAITVSFGIAALLPGETGEALLKRADSALYASKENGRNRITIAPQELAENSRA